MRVIETSLGEDLSLFSAYLWQQRIRHRVFEERGRQVLEVSDQAAAGRVQQAYEDWLAGRLTLTPITYRPTGSALLKWCLRYPGVVSLVVLAGVLLPFTLPLGAGELTAVAAWMTIVDLREPYSSAPGLLDVVLAGQIWRWVLPAFIHFSALHILFNATVLIYLGTRVEARFGWWGLWALVLVLALVSNLGQYAMNPNPLFGGLSGVGYGLLGFTLVMQRRRVHDVQWQVPGAFSGSMLVFLVAFSTGLTEQLFGLHIANTAHWVGLVVGAAVAWGVSSNRAGAAS